MHPGTGPYVTTTLYAQKTLENGNNATRQEKGGRGNLHATIPRRTSQVLCVWMLQIYIKVLPLANTEV